MAVLLLFIFLLVHGLCLGLLDHDEQHCDTYTGGGGGHGCTGTSNSLSKDGYKDAADSMEQVLPELSDNQASAVISFAPSNFELSDSFSSSSTLQEKNLRGFIRNLKLSFLSYLARIWSILLMPYYDCKARSSPFPASHHIEKPWIHMTKVILSFVAPAQSIIPGSSSVDGVRYSIIHSQVEFHPVPSNPSEPPSPFRHLADPLSAPPVFNEVPLAWGDGGMPSALPVPSLQSSLQVSQSSEKLAIVPSKNFHISRETDPGIIFHNKASNMTPLSFGSPWSAPVSPGIISPENNLPPWKSPSPMPITALSGSFFSASATPSNMYFPAIRSGLSSSFIHSAASAPSISVHEIPPLQADGSSSTPLSEPQPSFHPNAHVQGFFVKPSLTLPVLSPNVLSDSFATHSPQPQPVFHPVTGVIAPVNSSPFKISSTPELSIWDFPSFSSFPRKSPDRNNTSNYPAPTEEPMMSDNIPLQTPQFVVTSPMQGIPSIPVIGRRLEAPYPIDTSKQARHPTLGSPMSSIKINYSDSVPQVMPPVLHSQVHVPSVSPVYNFQVPLHHNMVPSLAPLQQSHAPYGGRLPTYISPPLSNLKHHHKYMVGPAPFQASASGSPLHAIFPVHSSPGHGRSPFQAPQTVVSTPVVPRPVSMPLLPKAGHAQSPFQAPQITEPKLAVPSPLLVSPLPKTGLTQAPIGTPKTEPRLVIPKSPMPVHSPLPNKGHVQAPFHVAPVIQPIPATPSSPISLLSPNSGHVQAPPVIQPMPATPRASMTFLSPSSGHNKFPVDAPQPAIAKSPDTSLLPSAHSGHAHAPDGKPQTDPEPAIPRTPRIFSSPPPSPGCVRASCSAPYTQTLSSIPCGCVLPIQVELELGVALYALFPLISVLAEEIANGTLLLQIQVRITGADAASENQEKSIVDINLVPLSNAFDRVTALSVFDRFWKHLIYIDPSLFGDYTVIFIRYPGLPPSPPLKNPGQVVPGEPFQINGSNAEQPLGVDIKRVHKKVRTGTTAVIASSAAIAVVLCLGIICFMLIKCSNNSNLPLAIEHVHISSMPKRSGGVSFLSSEVTSSTSMSLASSMATYAGSAKMFTLYELEKATNKLNSQNVVGEGGFGRVYRGNLDDGTMVAVKVLTRYDEQGGREFMAEVEMLSRLHHRNLVKLIGICIEERNRCLVYEFVPNGSLESHLHGTDRKSGPMDWDTRMKIALGAARGLAYLHEDSNPRVIHRDFKASNILLEDDFTPKVSDFGLAKAAPDEGSRHISTRVMGTFGYVAPEYAMTGHLLVKSDVYSYGVVLLELLSGRKPVDMSQPPGQENLVTWARPLLTSREGLQILIDPGLGCRFSFNNVAKVAAIASMCVQPEVSDRPFMGEVVQALKFVYNDAAVSNGIVSVNGSQMLQSPSCDHHARTQQLDHDISRAPHIQEITSFMSIDYELSSTHGDDLEKRPLSASALFSDSRWLLKKHSDSFRRHTASGPLRTNRENSPCYRASRINHGSMSDHALCRYFSGSIDRDFYRLWP